MTGYPQYSKTEEQLNIGLHALGFLLSVGGLFALLLRASGVSYTLGAILYSIRALPLNHAIFHLFVLIGSSCHFVAVYFYIASGSV